MLSKFFEDFTSAFIELFYEKKIIRDKNRKFRK